MYMRHPSINLIKDNKSALYRSNFATLIFFRPKIPTTHKEFLDIIVPDKYSKTADQDDFLVFRDYLDEDETKSMTICLSGFAKDILRTHSTWMMDGTFRSCPAPYTQVSEYVKKGEVNNYLIAEVVFGCLGGGGKKGGGGIIFRQIIFYIF